jgi:hypothetical protein
VSGIGSQSSSASGIQNTVRLDSDSVWVVANLVVLVILTFIFSNFTTGVSLGFLTTSTVGENFLVGTLSNVMRAGILLLVGPSWG